MTRPIRPEVRARFQTVVARAVERADRERAERLASLRPAPTDPEAHRRAMRGAASRRRGR